MVNVWQPNLAGRRKVVERMGVMAGPTGRQSWSEAVKALIAAESFEAGAWVVDVARGPRCRRSR